MYCCYILACSDCGLFVALILSNPVHLRPGVLVIRDPSAMHLRAGVKMKRDLLILVFSVLDRTGQLLRDMVSIIF